MLILLYGENMKVYIIVAHENLDVRKLIFWKIPHILLPFKMLCTNPNYVDHLDKTLCIWDNFFL